MTLKLRKIEMKEMTEGIEIRTLADSSSDGQRARSIAT